MSGTTSIEWATDTWNPTKGCDRVSPGCDHCYAMTMAKRLKGMGSPGYQQDGDPRTSGPGFLAHESPTDLDWPLRKTKPRLIFVNSMSDLFHDNISDEFIAEVWAIMALAPRHTFQVLTKRHARMRSLLSSNSFQSAVEDIGYAIKYPADQVDQRANDQNLRVWPLPNVWLGVSVEDQQWADIRIPALLDTPAAVRFLSCEPLLDEVSLFANSKIDTGTLVDWVIVGGESGPGARPMNARWARQLRNECNEYEIPFLFKQWGSHDSTGRPMNKHAAGRELDGRTWDEYPAAIA